MYRCVIERVRLGGVEGKDEFVKYTAKLAIQSSTAVDKEERVVAINIGRPDR